MPNAILYDLLTAIQTSIVNRGLSGITAENVVIQKRPATKASDLPAAKFPCILIAPWGAEDMGDRGTILHDDIGYPIVVAVVANDQNDQQANFNQYLYWRESIRKLFNAQPLPNQVTATVNGTSYASGKLAQEILVRPLDIVDKDAWDKLGNFASGLVLNCNSRETRG